MKKSIIVLIVIGLTLSLLPFISAKSSEVFIDYLSDTMWKDCQGKDIHINSPGVLTYAANNSNVSLIMAI